MVYWKHSFKKNIWTGASGRSMENKKNPRTTQELKREKCGDLGVVYYYTLTQIYPQLLKEEG
jgi:hypothetical protein